MQQNRELGCTSTVRLPRGLLELAGSAINQSVAIVAEGSRVVIRASEQAPRYELDDLVAGIAPENLAVDHEWINDQSIGNCAQARYRSFR